MKKCKLIKYSLILMFLFLGIFSIDMEVEAEEIVCNYSFEFTYEHTNSDGTIDNANSKADFQLILDDSQKATGFEGYSKYRLNVTGAYSIQNRYPVGTSSRKIIYLKNDGDSCPQVTLYQRRAGIIGEKYNISKFYIHSENEKNYNESATDLVNACVGKSEDDEVLSGYRCGNIIGPISGTKNVTACDEEDLEKIRKYKDQLYNTYLKKPYEDEINRISRNASSFTNSDTTTQEVCDKFINQSSIDPTSLMNGADKVATEIDAMINQLDCIADETVINELKNYSYSGKIITFADQASSYSNSLGSHYTTLSNLCLSKIPDLTEKEENELKQEADKNRDDAQEKIETSIDDASKKIDQAIETIDRIDLGSDVGISCEGLLGDKLLDLISEIFGYVQIAAPILLIVLGGVDFGQAVMTDDKDALKKATSKFVKRAIICVVIFFVPTILNYLLGFLNDIGKDPLCGIK